MFNFIKRQEFKEPNEPAKMIKKKTKSEAALRTDD